VDPLVVPSHGRATSGGGRPTRRWNGSRRPGGPWRRRSMPRSTSSVSTRTTPSSSSSPRRNRDCSVSDGARRASAPGFARRARARSVPSETGRARHGAAARVGSERGGNPAEAVRAPQGPPGAIAPAGRNLQAARPRRTRDERGLTRRSRPRLKPGRSSRAAGAAGVVEGMGGADRPHGRKVWLRRKR
jgi:hypothetical protein